MVLASMPGMSSWLHVNTSKLSFKKLMISFFIQGSRFDPT